MKVNARKSARVEKEYEELEKLEVGSIEEFNKLKEKYSELVLFDNENRRIQEFERIEIENKYTYFDETKYLPIRYTEYDNVVQIREINAILDGIYLFYSYNTDDIKFGDNSYMNIYYIKQNKLYVQIKTKDQTSELFEIDNSRVVDYNIREKGYKIHKKLLKYIGNSEVRKEVKEILLNKFKRNN